MGSLLNDEALSWVGRRIEIEGDEITETMVRQFIYATEDAHPAYVSDLTAADAGTPRVVPPMLYQGATRPYVPLSDYAPDGTVKENRPIIGSGQAMGGTLSVEWLRPLRVGDRLTGTRTLLSMNEKNGSTRQFVVVIWQTEYRDQNGEVVIREQYEQIVF